MARALLGLAVVAAVWLSFFGGLWLIQHWMGG